MSQAQDIRTGIANSLSSLLSTSGGPLGQINAYPTSQVAPPCAYVADGEIQYDFAMGRGADGPESYGVVVLFPATQDVSQQQQLDALRGGTGALSIKTLIEADRTLGGKCQALRVTKLSRTQLYETAGQPARVGCEWTVEVYA